jgi:excisionase family DNA binding protein
MINVSSKEARKYYSVDDSTIRRWAREGIINFERTKGGHYRYSIPTICNKNTEEENIGQYIIYARVSSKKQEEDLERQVRHLKSMFKDHTIIKDIGSGLNYKRKGFQTILEQLFKGNIKRVVVAHQDRFTRFGFDFFEWLFKQFGAVLESVDRTTKSREEELLGDVMEVFTVFTARYYGSRKYKNKDNQDSDLSE